MTTQNPLRFGEFLIDRRTRELWHNDSVLPVSGKAFDLLCYMVENPGRPLSKAELLDAVWPNVNVEESNLSQNVFLLRKALGSQGPIKTLPGLGYQFTSIVSEARSSAASAAPHPTPLLDTSLYLQSTRVVVEDEVEEHLVWMPRQTLYLALAVITTIGAICWFGWRYARSHTGGEPVQLVLARLDGTTGDGTLDQALTDALSMDLSNSPLVSVVPESVIRATLIRMNRQPGELVTPTVAREICERTDSQAVLRGSIARSGMRYLLTAEVSSCLDGAVLAAAKQEAVSADDLPHRIDALGAYLRHRLGESRQSVARFSNTLYPERTPSLEALEAYSQALHLAPLGRVPEAIALVKQAVKLDPRFAAAWLELSVLSGNAGDYAGQRLYVATAYALREEVDQSTRFNIIAMYNQAVTGDLYEALSNFQAWSTLYPRSATPWSGLLQTNRQLGRHSDAVAAGQHALQLNPQSATVYYGLALEQLHAGDPRAARSTCELALSRGFDSDTIHGVLFRVAVALNDAALRSKQESWSDGHPNAVYMLTSRASLALASGRLRESKSWMERAAEAYRRQGINDVADAVWRQSAPALANVGDIEGARSALAHGTLDVNEPFEYFSLVAVGEGAKAHSFMRAELARHPQATLTGHLLAPWLQAKLDLRAHRPADAWHELEGISNFDDVFIETRFDRGLALLDNDRNKEAAEAFRSVVERPYLDVLSEAIPLSWLNLARALAREGDIDQAAQAYHHFFALWAGADPQEPLLQVARKDYRGLTAHAIPPSSRE